MSGTGSASIRVEDVGKTYEATGGDVVAIEDVNFEIPDRELFCLLGPSGCGKSTLLRVIGGLVDATTGSVDIDVERADEDGLATNMIFQEYGVFPWKSVIDNVAFGLKMQGMGKQERYEIARDYIEKVNLTGFEDAYPHQLSGGMKQRVGIARAFANDPEILLMDEPFGALDAQTKTHLQGELLELWEESRKTIVYVTHDIDEAILMGDRLAVMTARPGRIKEIIDIDLDRPRDVISTAERSDLRERVWDILSEEVEKSMQEQS